MSDTNPMMPATPSASSAPATTPTETSAATSAKPTFTPTPEQQRIIEAPIDADELVVAGAGSGKTFTMTQRIIALIHEGVAPEKILGLTFTRKATAELLSRVSTAVMEDARDVSVTSMPADTTANSADTAATHSPVLHEALQGIPNITRASAIERTMNRAFMKPDVSTYDAFFQSIVRKYGLLVGFDQHTKPLSDAGSMQIIYDIIDEHRDILLNDDSGFGDITTIARAVKNLSDNIASSMISDDCLDMHTAAARIHDWDNAFIRQLDDMIGDVTEFEVTSMPKAPSVRKNAKNYEKQLAEKSEQFQEMWFLYTLYEANELRATTRRREMLLMLVEAFDAEKRARNVAQFSDFTIAAFQLISRFPSIGEKYRRRYSHVLLDEYQDTSTTQAMLLKKLFHESALDRSAVSAVGDPFQSIYAFRGASPGAFALYKDLFDMPATAKPYTLTQTRRNAKIVLEAANMMTGPLRAVTNRRSSTQFAEVDVDPLVAMSTARDGLVATASFDTLGQETDAVVRFAQRAIAKYSAADPAQDDAPHVAILFRSSTHMFEYRDALERAGLTAVIVGKTPYFELPEVMDVRALLQAVSDHTDAQSLLRLMATPRYAVSASGLRALAELANSLNVCMRFRALVEAGIVAPLEQSAAASNTGAATEPSDTEQTTDASDAINATSATDTSASLDSGDTSDISADQLRAMKMAVTEHSKDVPNIVFLADVLLRDDLDELLRNTVAIDAKHVISSADVTSSDFSSSDAAAISVFSESDIHSIEQTATAMRAVQSALYEPIPMIITAAVQALGLDIDLPVANAMHIADDLERFGKASPAAKRESDTVLALEAFNDLARQYIDEVSGDMPVTLRGFLGWINMLEETGAETSDNSAQAADAAADVVLMTVHKSKGLEWDAVAIVDVNHNTFPSNQGDWLSIQSLDADPYHPQKFEELWDYPSVGISGEPEYRERAYTWLEQSSSVPAPVRADSALMPPFPRNSKIGDNALLKLQELDNAATLEDEVFGEFRYAPLPELEDMDIDALPLSQAEEYGRRLHADERRLMYVALTRARYEVFVTAAKQTTLARMAEGRQAVAPSNFWLELFQRLGKRDDAITAPMNVETPALSDDERQSVLHDLRMQQSASHRTDAADDAGATDRAAGAGDADGEMLNLNGSFSDTDMSNGMSDNTVPEQSEPERVHNQAANASMQLAQLAPLPKFVAVGDGAQEFADTVIGDAWNETITPLAEPQRLTWPADVSLSIRHRIDDSVTHVRNAIDAANAANTDNATDRVDAITQADSELANAELESIESTAQESLGLQTSPAQPSLLASAQRLIADIDLSPQVSLQTDDIDERARELGMKHVATQRNTASATLARAGLLDAQAQRDYWRAVIRPIPQVAPPSASAGTQFHAWAERYLLADSASGALNVGVSRKAMEHDVMQQHRALQEQTVPSDDRVKHHQHNLAWKLNIWQRHLIYSTWAHRQVAWTERNIVAHINELGDQLQQGKLDAVFIGGIDETDTSKKYTIVDWKTGAKPRTPEQIATKLLQLDFYRLLLAQMEQIPIETIDAALVYINVNDNNDRMIRADNKSRHDIIRELSIGLPYLNLNDDDDDIDIDTDADDVDSDGDGFDNSPDAA